MTIEGTISAVIDQAVAGIYRQNPGLLEKFGERGIVKCREDNQHHMDHLETAFSVDDVQIFIDYAVWLNDILTVRGMKTEHLISNFRLIQEAIGDKLTPHHRGTFYQEALEQAVLALSKGESLREGVDGSHDS
ncbi:MULTISPECIES: hypothetical protein [Sediminibacillus]|uniref:hypothetical protein n=1 Tax=Sediminibacillus TaxID=482460 RepID=UPI00040E0804|nr:hypothetical protein [Sediminibacillus terrae]